MKNSYSPVSDEAMTTSPRFEERVTVLNLEVTGRCNFNCVYCPQELSSRPGIAMTLGLAKKVIAWAEKRKIPSVGFSSLGEPLLHPQLTRIIKEAKSKGLTTFLATNGSLFKKGTVIQLARAGIDFLVLGVNASNEKEFRLRRSRLTFKKYLTGVKLAIREFIRADTGRMTLVLSFISTQGMTMPSHLHVLHTQKHKAALIQSWKAFIQRNLSRAAAKKRPAISQPDNRELFGDASAVIAVTDKIYIRIMPLELDLAPSFIRKSAALPVKEQGYCPSINNRLVVLANGETTFCCQKDFNGVVGLGNVNQDHLQAVCFGKKARLFRKLNARNFLPTEYCRSCQARAQYAHRLTRTS